MIDFIGYIANAATWITLILSAKKIWCGPICGLVAEVIWLYYAYLLNAWPIGISAVVMGVVYAIAIPKWYRERP